MYKRKDNDIFGTASLGYTPRIENNSYIDPHAAFKKKTDQNYERYNSKVHPISHHITGKFLDQTKVNEEANFEQDYHKDRKEKDMQSSIFYPPRTKVLPENNSFQSNKPTDKSQKETNYGRKETLTRQIHDLPYNNSNLIKGNSSRLFDFDQKIDQNDKKQKILPLIPHQMQWDQHDSVKYSHINSEKHQNSPKNIILNIEDSKSMVFQKKQIQNQKDSSNNLEKKDKKLISEVKIKSVKSQKQIKIMSQKEVIDKKGPVEIKIQKGWDSKFLQGLSKHCKLNGTTMIKFEVDEESRGMIVLKRTQRWQNVADWLRKDAKLKIRVVNP